MPTIAFITFDGNAMAKRDVFAGWISPSIGVNITSCKSECNYRQYINLGKTHEVAQNRLRNKCAFIG